jgi:putative ABC transport system substrate-binding protein
MKICLRRREFVAALRGAAAWPLAARAQQRALPVIGYLSSRTPESDASLLVAVRRGLGDVGYAEGRNVSINYRFTDGRYDRLPAQLTNLMQRKVDVIVFAGFPLVEELVQQVRTSLIPIVTNSDDPVRIGLVASLNRPGGNVTGFSPLMGELSGKRVGLLHDLVPKAATVAAPIDPGQPSGETITVPDARSATAALGQKLLVLEASTPEEIDAQFASLDQEPADAMLVAATRFFTRGRGRLRRSRLAVASPQSTHGASLSKPAAS